MKATEHRAIGDAAAGGDRVWLGGPPPLGMEIGFGDVVALSGDFFVADDSPVLSPTAGHEATASGSLFDLAGRVEAESDAVGTRAEVIMAMKVMADDAELLDRRFTPSGEYFAYCVAPTPSMATLERRVRDRFLALGASNDDHFLAPGARGPATMTDRPRARHGSAVAAYRELHRVALAEANGLGASGGDLRQAMAREAAAQHFLTDCFAAGHLRTPVASMREYWQQRYPFFWENLRRKVARDTAEALRDLALPLRLVPRARIHDRTLDAVWTRTQSFPRVSLGDLLAKAFHDWDNTHGLAVEGGGWVFGDGLVHHGVTWSRALAAVRAGIDDVEVAFDLGRGGRVLAGGALDDAVRSATGAPAASFLPETLIPRVSAANPALNWLAPDIDTLWNAPIAGSRATTVGEAVIATLEAGAELPRRLGCLAHGIGDSVSVPPVPGLRRWISTKACAAYQRGFLDHLERDPREVVFDVAGTGVAAGTGLAAPAPDARGAQLSPSP